MQKTTLWLRVFLDYAKKVGYAGTWGPGQNVQNTIHVRDTADILLFIFKAALEGRAAEGADGLCRPSHIFARSVLKYSTDFAVTDTTLAYGEWARKMGDVNNLATACCDRSFSHAS